MTDPTAPLPDHIAEERCMCGELKRNRAHYETQLSGWHPYVRDSDAASPTAPLPDEELARPHLRHPEGVWELGCPGCAMRYARAFYEVTRHRINAQGTITLPDWDDIPAEQMATIRHDAEDIAAEYAALAPATGEGAE